MKIKMLMAMAAAWLGMNLTATAENTDVTAIDNTVYIEPTTATIGSTALLSVKMKNTVEVEGLQFTLVLPEGVSVVTEPDTAVCISSARTDSTSVYGLLKAVHDDGSLTVLAASHERKPFTGNDGEVLTITVRVAKGTVPGTYPVYLRDIALSDSQEIPASYYTPEVETSITVSLRGDVNRDGQVGIGDIVAITNVMAGNNDAGYEADVNGDGQVGIGDIVDVTNIMAGEEEKVEEDENDN